METKFVFNHELDSFNGGIGINEQIALTAREKIIFNCINNFVQRDLLYGEEDNDICPRELKTITGDLERLVKLVDSELELYAVLLNFKTMETMCIQSYKRYLQFKQTDSEKDDIKSKLFELIEVIESAKSEAEDDENEPLIERYNQKTMFKRIEFIKKSHSNFNTYMNMLLRWSRGESVEDNQEITDLLNNILNKSDDHID